MLDLRGDSCLCSDADRKGLIDRGIQLSFVGWSWCQEPGQIESLCAGRHCGVHWKNKAKQTVSKECKPLGSPMQHHFGPDILVTLDYHKMLFTVLMNSNVYSDVFHQHVHLFFEKS